MPALTTEVQLYLKRVRDTLRTGPAYASAGLILGTTTSRVQLVAQDPGVLGNSINIAVTVPAGTSALAVTVSGRTITIALNVSAGVPQAASNTATLIVAALTASAAALALVQALLPTGSGAGSLSTAVALPLSGGAGGGESGVDTLPLNFLRAQDTASVLEVLMEALTLSAAITATGGTAVSVQDTGAFIANTQIGNTILFTGNTTAALAGRTAVVVSNTANACFFATGAIPATPAAGDTYRVIGTFSNPDILALRGARGKGDAPPGNLYGDSRSVTNAFVRIIQQLVGSPAFESTLWTGNSAAAGSSLSTVVLNTRGGAFRIDEFKNMKLAVSGFTARKVTSNDATSVTFAPPLGSVPGAVATVISYPQDRTTAGLNYTFAPGGSPHDAKYLAELLRAAQVAVTAFVLPT